MKKFVFTLGLVALLFAGCKSTQTNVAPPDSSSKFIFSMERTGCFGRCAVYRISLYENRLLYYEAIKNTGHDGQYCFRLTKQEFATWIANIEAAGLPEMGEKFPTDRPIPPDLPACIIKYEKDGQKKKITEYGNGRPEALITLEKQVDEDVKNRKLHTCDK